MIRWLKKFLLSLGPPTVAVLEADVRESIKHAQPDHLAIARARLPYYRTMPFDNKGLLILNTDLATVFFALSSVHEKLGNLSPEQYAPLHGIAADLKIIKDALDTGLKMEHDDVYGCWRER